MVKIIVLVRPGKAKRLKKMRFCYCVGAFGGFRVLPDAFFVDFGPNLGWILHVFFERISDMFLVEKVFRLHGT